MKPLINEEELKEYRFLHHLLSHYLHFMVKKLVVLIVFLLPMMI